MKPRLVKRLALIPALLVVLAVGLSTLKSSEDAQYNPLDKAFYLSAEDTVWIRPGLKLEITDVSIPEDRKPVVRFKITDDKDQPLDRTGVFTPATVSTSFVLSYIPADGDQYVNYNTRSVTSPITSKTATQATTDSGGRYISFGDGIYTYTFGNALPASYDRTATHTLGIYSARDLREFDLSRYVANALKTFVPDGREVTKVREVVATKNCNQCHNPLGLHGGTRRETGLCILCHTPQSSDPDTGNTVDFKVMVHKIHMGENLPSVKAGTPYEIIGFGQTVFDFSEIAFPRDIRNCETCHTAASQASNWMLKPSRAVCGACHDDVNWKSGENHAAGAQVDDKNCVRCHWPEGEYEYDASITGAHIVPYKSTQLRKPKFEILDIKNTKAGDKPTVQFKITDKDGKAIAPSAVARLSLTLAGPTSDYKWYIREAADKASYADGVATFTFMGSLPTDAAGTYCAGIEGVLNTTLNPGTTKEFVYAEGGENVVKRFAVTGSVTSRRAVVDIAKCNKCHDKRQNHGNRRNQTDYCVMCHNPTFTDADQRPASALPGETLHFKSMIHRIHSGEELESDFTVYDAGVPENFNELHFPGDLRDCTTCHVGTSYTLPLTKGLLSTITPRWLWTPTRPVAAACLGCHDSESAAAHASVNTANFGESCEVCHKEGADFAVSKVHAR